MEDNRGWWRFFDGSISVSATMLVAVLLSKCGPCGGWTVIGFVKGLTEQDSGVIAVATMLLFPVTLTFYGGAQLVFAAKEAVERRTRERLKKQREEGRKEGRKILIEELMQKGVITPEFAKSLEDKAEDQK